ncbi:LOW QUALITY PROTEIN: Bardet-Biedl syndrome 12 protein [Phycodurus eques]|uniref:LOW QUALITY PROTEIN: Bardet-Biedl syndrome 12 protein n=1 Tax=Phycodurus eques TaxID=693459 RepID=UPI002ACE260D|nr:LOW QUALITY PROTEIN: Bardet-Biedl syndrome 12 protein [Phycodurus eques]
MLGSTIINHRQHVGLQQLFALASAAHSTLGPHKKYKFIQDEATGESILVGSCFRILENLDLTTCAVGQLVHETVRAHHEVYRTGSEYLLFFAGAWSRAALSCLQQGIPTFRIVEAMTEGMDLCVDVCKKSSVSFDALCASPRKRVTEAPSDTKVGKGKRQVKLSRYFCNTKPERSPVQEPRLPDIANLAGGLSHGCDDAMRLVIQASRIQSKDIPSSAFDVTKVTTCVLPGFPEDHAHICPGCVVLLNGQQASVAHHLKDQSLDVVVICGDLSHTYRHLGFNRPAGVQRVGDQSDLSNLSVEEEWIGKVLALLSHLEVDLVLVSGLVNEAVFQLCSQHRILVVGKVKVSILKEVANAIGAVPVTYATQLSKRCIGKGVQVSIWREIQSHKGTPLTAANIYASASTRLVTAVITSCVHGKLQALEDRFWACAYRIHHALKDKAVLPGAGVTEMLCIRRLMEKVDAESPRDGTSGSNPYLGIVLHLLADSFKEYLSTLMANSTGISQVKARTAVNQKLQDFNGISAEFSQLILDSDVPPSKIFDNLSVKQESWRKALDLVLLVLQTDAEIITGVDQSKCDHADLVFL